jgi:hypothetical protein
MRIKQYLGMNRRRFKNEKVFAGRVAISFGINSGVSNRPNLLPTINRV